MMTTAHEQSKPVAGRNSSEQSAINGAYLARGPRQSSNICRFQYFVDFNICAAKLEAPLKAI
jgi:hypothetical protein